MFNIAGPYEGDLMKKKALLTFVTSIFATALMGCSNSTTSSELEMKNYSFQLNQMNGVGVAETEIYLKVNGKTAYSLYTDSTGLAGRKLPVQNYTIEFGGKAASWTPDKTEVTTEEQDVVITFETSIINDEKPEDKQYQIGDVIYDFEICAVETDGTANRKMASEYLKDHDCLVINLWATYCNPCRAEMPYMNEAWKQVKDDVALVAISSYKTDTIKAIAKYKEEVGVDFPIGPDEVFQSDDYKKSIVYGFYPEYIPATAIIDRYGIVQETYEAAITNVDTFLEKWSPYCGDNYAPAMIQ